MSLRTWKRGSGLMLLVLLLLLTAGTSATADLAQTVQEAVNTADLGAATVGISIRDADSDRELVRLGADQSLIPASNMKLLTTGAALFALGPDFEFHTPLLYDGQRLIVVGDGDPGFGDPELLKIMTRDDVNGLDVEDFLEFWVRAVVESGIDRVEEIVVDDRVFDRNFVHESWPVEQLNRSYCAEVSGLIFHNNVLHFFPRPSEGSRPIIANYKPLAPWLELKNQGTCRRGDGEKSTAWIARAGDRYTFYGNVPFAYRTPVPVTVHDMPLFFAHLLADRLSAKGVAVGGFRTVDPGRRWTNTQPIGPVITTPISTAITRCNRDSENLYAEALLKRMGHQVTGESGSWTTGAAVLRHVLLEKLNRPELAQKVIVADGSGLSRDNRVAAATMTRWLNVLHQDPYLGELFQRSLASAGESGTLENRFRDADLHGAVVRAKSGYINQVSCLSGYVSAPGGRERSFSILINDLSASGSVRKAKRLQERIVCLIAEDLAVPAAEAHSSP